MILFGALSLIVQILAVLHVIRTGRNQIWIWIIMFGSLLGCTAYFAFELMPEIFGPGSRYARAANAKIQGDPVRQLRAAEAALERADTAASRTAAGDAHMALGAHREAALQYQIALDRFNAADAKIEAKLAWALFESGDLAKALAVSERIAEPNAIGEKDRLAYQRARILVELGRREEAAALYDDIATRLPGEEVHCRHAALLLDLGRSGDARAALEIVERQLKARGAVDSDPAMLDWAKTQLRSLRAGT